MILFRNRRRLLAVSLALVSGTLTTAAHAQNSPLLPLKNPHPHRLVRPNRTPQPVITGGFSANYAVAPSLNSPPVTFGPNGSGSQASDWVGLGPTPIGNAFGTVGAYTSNSAGRIVGIATDPNNANTYYIAAAGGGVWKTTDAGVTFTALTDGLPNSAMGAVAVASDSNTVYAGTGEASFSGDSRYGSGLIKSTNGGVTWTVIPGPGNVFKRRSVSRIVISPTDPKTVYVALAYSGQFGFFNNFGVWKTTDGGTSWANTTSGFINTIAITDLAIAPKTDPKSLDTLYAAVGNPSGSSSNGVYKSTDGGTTWALAGNFPTSSNTGRISFALAPSNPQVLYASVANASTGGLLGLYRTADGGATWTKKTATPDYLGAQGWYDNTIVVSPTDANRVFAAGVVNYGANNYGEIVGLIVSTDGGNSWTDLSVGKGYQGPHTDHHALAITADGKLLNGNDGGLWRLENTNQASYVIPNGTTDNSDIVWTNLNASLTITQFTGIALHPTTDTIAYGGSQDNGTEKYTGSTTWKQVIGGDGGFVRVDQDNPNTVYHEFYGISLQRSDNGGLSWVDKIGGINTKDETVIDDFSPTAFYVPYILDPGNQSKVVLGTNHVYVSTNKGDNFSIIANPNVNGFNTDNQAVIALGVSGTTYYCATSSRFHTSTNNGVNWANTSPSGRGGSIQDIYVNPNYAPDVFIARAEFTGSSAAHIFRSTDSGTTWKDISGNLPDQPYNAVKLDKKSGTLYVGGDDGVYYSSNFGGSWARLGTALPNVQVVDLAISNGAGILGAGTHGRGMWNFPLFTNIAKGNVIVQPSLTRNGGNVLCTLVLKNSGNGDTTGVTITSVTVNNLTTTGAAPAVGIIPAASTKSGGQYTCPPLTAGTRAIVRVTGTSAQGKFSAALNLIVP